MNIDGICYVFYGLVQRGDNKVGPVVTTMVPYTGGVPGGLLSVVGTAKYPIAAHFPRKPEGVWGRRRPVTYEMFPHVDTTHLQNTHYIYPQLRSFILPPFPLPSPPFKCSDGIPHPT